MDSDPHTRQAENLTAMLHVWPDIERALLDEPHRSEVADAVAQAFRVEASAEHGCEYTLFFDVEIPAAREAAAVVDRASSLFYTGVASLYTLANERLPGVPTELRVRMVSERKPIEGEVCPRVMATPAIVPTLEELPNPEPEGSTVPLIERDRYWLTPIEEPFYDALCGTDLTFAVQPWVQQHSRRYRVDFIVYWVGRAVVVELDGKEGHISDEDRKHDYQRERWLQERGLRVVRWTGSDVYADATGCVRQLVEMLRGTQARA